MAPRQRKVGVTRMDAAIDAMHSYGFPRDVVRKTVNSLLKVYGGDSGWVFIEDASYSLLVDTILEQDKKIRATDDETCDDHSRAHEELSPESGNLCIGESSTGGNSMLTLPTHDAAGGHSSGSGPDIGQTQSSPPRPRRAPCYGWISEEEEEEEEEVVVGKKDEVDEEDDEEDQLNRRS